MDIILPALAFKYEVRRRSESEVRERSKEGEDHAAGARAETLVLRFYFAFFYHSSAVCNEEMSLQIKEMLKQICVNNGWSYAIFWRINYSNPMLLMLEDSYYEPPRYSVAVDSSSLTKGWEALSEHSCSIQGKLQKLSRRSQMMVWFLSVSAS